MARAPASKSLATASSLGTVSTVSDAGCEMPPAQPESKKLSGRRTPLPLLQLFIIMLICFAEPIAGTVIYPFINKFVRETGIIEGDEKKTGYYAGIVESAFFLAESTTVIIWGFLSDRYGRRPILIVGPLGISLATLLFGMTSKFWPLVLFRCLQGFFNGNIGVTKSVIAEISDPTNIGDAFALIPVTWSLGITLGPIIGGVFADPATEWPDTFGRLPYLRDHPYFLPCAIVSCMTFTIFVITVLGLRESLPSKRAPREPQSPQSFVDTERTPLLRRKSANSEDSVVGNAPIESSAPASTTQASADLGTILRGPISYTLLNYAFLAFLDMANFVLLPLIYSTSVSLGGLGLEPYRIGLILAAAGIINSVVQAFLLGPLIRRFGARKTYMLTFPCAAGFFILYPIMTCLARRAGGVDGWVAACVVLHLSLQPMTLVSYGTIQVLLTQDIPEQYLGTVYGIAQMIASGTRALAPTVASSLYSVTLQKHLMGGNMVFYVLLCWTLVGVWCTKLVPRPTTTTTL